MTINFQYNSLTFFSAVDSPAENVDLLPEGTPIIDCFKHLTEGRGDIAVRGINPRQLLDYIHKYYIFVKAAGGIVENSDGRRLLMVRNDRCDLPKGKVEDGETLAQAALRETSEETGLSDLQRGPLLLKTYHIYNLYGGWHFKQTSWFAMRLLENQPLVPQLDEGITSLEWLPADQWRYKLGHSYATMKIITGQILDNRLINHIG
ncbi:MAG: NUDIX domain-containing protein [Bacteroidales bacterium]|nr:NUDIX domain-containing protein [Bacteroidales bacterium]